MSKENKSSSPKQACVDCHFFSYAMKYYNSNQYSEEAVDGYYRNWIKEKCYNYNQSAEVPDECDYSKGYNNEKAPDRYVVGLKCYKNVWPVIELSMKKIPRTPDIKTCSFLHTVPKYREKAFEEMSAVERKDRCFFYKYVPGMHLETAEKLEGKKSAQIKEIEPEDKQQSGGYKFHLSGDTWILSYEGKTIHLQDSIGLKYIHYLLNNPEKESQALELVRVISKSLSPKDIYNKMNNEQLEGQLIEEGLSKESTGEVIDRKTIKDYKDQLEKLKNKLEDAIELNNDEEVAEITDEIEQIKKALNAGRDIHGQPRKVAGNVEKARKAVSKAYHESLKKIEDGHPALGKHFENTLTIGIYCSYKPEKSIHWDL